MMVILAAGMGFGALLGCVGVPVVGVLVSVLVVMRLDGPSNTHLTDEDEP